MANRARKTTGPIQEFFHADQQLNLDQIEEGIVKNVKFLGPVSANGRDYPEQSRRNAIEKKRAYEEAKVYINHPSGGDTQQGPRAFQDLFGVMRATRHQSDGGFCNFHFNPKHPLAEAFKWLAKNEPKAIGFSHNINGATTFEGGREIVEEIIEVHSVDLVTDPATTNGLFESRGRSMKTIKAKDVLAKIFEGKATKKKIVEEDMAAMGESPMEAPAESASTEDQMKAAFSAMVCGIAEDDSLDLKAKVAKIKDVLTAQEKLLAGDAPAESESEGGEETPAAEGKKKPKSALQEQVNRMQRQLEARELCDAENIVPNKVLRKALEAATDTEEMKSLIKDFKESRGQADGGNQDRPQSGSPHSMTEGRSRDQAKITEFKSTKDRVQFLRNGRM